MKNRGISTANYRRVMYVVPYANCGSWGLGDVGGSGQTHTWINNCKSNLTMAHELGHNLGFSHAATPGNGYGDSSDPMGGASGNTNLAVQFNAVNRMLAGWAAGSAISDISASGDYLVSPLETQTKTPAIAQVLRFPKPNSTDYFLLSQRKPVDLDHYLDSQYLSNLSIHLVSADSSHDPLLLKNLATGQSFDDASGVSIRTGNPSGDNLNVTIRLPQDPCNRIAPSITTDAASKALSAGASTSFLVTIKNNDSAACGSAAFALAETLDAGISSGLGAQKSLTLNPGQSTTLTWPLTASRDLLTASKTVQLTVSENNVTTYTAPKVVVSLVVTALPPPTPTPTPTTSRPTPAPPTPKAPITGSSPPVQVPVAPTTMLRSLQFQDMCMDASNNGSANGTKVIMWPCHGNPNQQWAFVNNQWRIYGNKCLDVDRGDGRSGMQLVIWDCSLAHSNSHQEWSFSNGVIRWNNSAMCLDNGNQKNTPGGAVVLWPCDDKNWNQKWLRK